MTNKVQPKPFKDFNQQLALLESRGLIIDDKTTAIHYLGTIGYYRLSGYFYPFRRQISPNSRADEFYDKTHFSQIKQLYMFDKRLRHLALDALERIEVAMRVQIAHRLSKYSATAHLQSQYFNGNFKRNKWLSKYYNLIEREQSSSDFVKHHESKYTDMPIWVHCELWDFGTMSTLYQGMLESDKDIIAKHFGLLSHKQLETQLRTFNIIRNISAHYSRLWNRHIGTPASFKSMGNDWHKFSVNNALIYFCLMQYFLKRISPNSQWGNRFLNLLDDFPKTENNIVNLRQFGLTIPLVDFKKWDLWENK